MNLVIFAIFAILLPGFGGWLGFLLIRQNGHLLLRLAAVEEQIERLVETQAGHYGKGYRPLTESSIPRGGLPQGTPAPDFRLPTLDGGQLSLSDYRGTRVLLVFSDPHCGPCNTLMPALAQAHRQHLDVQRPLSRRTARNGRRLSPDYRLSTVSLPSILSLPSLPSLDKEQTR